MMTRDQLPQVLKRPNTDAAATPSPIRIFRLSWNVVENKGPEMRKMRPIRLPWNVYENKQVNSIYPGILFINKVLSSLAGENVPWKHVTVSHLIERL
jgi:hypothetical protein